ncbi:MAG TPA: hypothetical protein VFD46_01805 [Chryseolinea sp.]|nr:hypothetical protein [Chryseolinea sp.]
MEHGIFQMSVIRLVIAHHEHLMKGVLATFWNSSILKAPHLRMAQQWQHPYLVSLSIIPHKALVVHYRGSGLCQFSGSPPP